MMSMHDMVVYMDVLVFFSAIFVLLFFMIFFHDIFPRCSCCKRIKPGVFFKIHKVVKIRFGYGASRSICKKCCRKYDIANLDDYKQIEKIRRKIEKKLETGMSIKR